MHRLTSGQANKKRNRIGGPGSGSDVEGGTLSGADLSDVGKTKKLKLNLSRSGTPLGSRSGSPAAPLRVGTPEGGPTLKGTLFSSVYSKKKKTKN